MIEKYHVLHINPLIKSHYKLNDEWQQGKEKKLFPLKKFLETDKVTVKIEITKIIKKNLKTAMRYGALKLNKGYTGSRSEVFDDFRS